MSTKNERLQSNWKHPDELIKLQRLKLRKKQLADRIQNKHKKDGVEDKQSLLETKISQKRKNPFAKESAETTKKPRNEPNDDSLLSLLDTANTLGPPKQVASVNENRTQTRTAAANLVLQPFDPRAFAKLLNSEHSAGNEEVLEAQKFSKHLPMDWSLKSRVRFFCSSELPATTLKTCQMASSLTSFVRCIDPLNGASGLDISPATRFHQATYYWQHPHIPWIKLFPRNSKENLGVTFSDRERKALAEDWDYSFRGLFQLLRARQCPYFYLCANTFTVLFRAAGTGGRVETHALMTPSTRGMRCALRQEGIEYTMPLKKGEAEHNKSNDNNSDESNSLGMGNSNKEALLTDPPGGTSDDDEADEDAWLESLEVDEKEIRRIQAAHTRKAKTQEMAEDFSDNSLLLIEGVECQGFFSFLLNAKSTISNVGRLAGVPPTLFAPVAFPRATMQHLTARSNKVRMDGVDYHSIEVKGIVLPTFLPYVCQLLGESKKTFSATLASSSNTLAFSKASKKLLESSVADTSKDEGTEDETGGQVFGQENLSDCGLLPAVIENMCRTGIDAVGLLEHVCYDAEFGFAWS